MKKILVLPGAAAQIPLIKKIHELGFLAYTINPYDNSPAFSISDGYCKADIMNRPACLEYARKIHADAVISDQCDIAMEQVSYLAEQLGVVGISLLRTALFRVKSSMRDFSRRNGLSCPEYQLCRTLDEALAFFRALGKKMIIKPLDSNSSRGVFTIQAETELTERFNESIKWSINQKAVICERYIEGTEFTIDGIKIPGCGHVCLAISEKRHFPHNLNIASKLYFSHRNANYDYDKLRKLDNAYVDLSGLEFGLTHAEYKCENGEFYLIEIGARGGGNNISSHIVSCMSGVDNMGILVRMGLGMPINPQEIQINKNLYDRCAVLQFFDFAPGKVKEIRGVDFLENNSGILDFRINFVPCDTIVKPTDDSKRVGYYIAYADTDAQLRALQNEITEKVTIEYE